MRIIRKSEGRLTFGDLPEVDPSFIGAEKLAAIKVIPRPGKDRHSRPKSYRSVSQLPVLGKTMERMLVGRLEWHLIIKPQATQYGFTLQRGT
ncbi:hypothetical protein EVAR_61625_1 [Eumeta japonica]|uniref:RNA-directed DNA polymerase from transposon X-element n=1 Tax=Eumeta variegata TaxID=151549 RepID=A0A4C1ZGC1_EUMVA|nr:hypothetical protein EVAR_61625_1 [Eumeta japonica]